MGLSDEEIIVRSSRGVVLERGGALQHRADAPSAVAKKGVKEAGGTPREFCTITVTDGIAMGHEGMKSSWSRVKSSPIRWN